MPEKTYDFCGYATKNDVKCTDGRTIRENAFIGNDGMTVPLVWQHLHDDPDNVLGHVTLENRPDGVYAYGEFNNSKKGQQAAELVANGDINSMSIYANHLKQSSTGDVFGGEIKEVSLVLAGANPEAIIEDVTIAHSDGTTNISDEDAIFKFNLLLDDSLEHADSKKKNTINEIIDSMDDNQKWALRDIIETKLLGKNIEDCINSNEYDPKRIKDYTDVSYIVEDLDDDELREAYAYIDISKVAKKYNLKHEDTEETIQDVVDTMSSKEKRAMYTMLSLALNNKDPEKIISKLDVKSKEKILQAKDIIDSMDENQKQAVYAYIGFAVENKKLKHSDEEEIIMNEERTVQDVLNEMDEEQLAAVEAYGEQVAQDVSDAYEEEIAEAMDEEDYDEEDVYDEDYDEDYDEEYDDEMSHSDIEEDNSMKTNVFDQDATGRTVLSHAEVQAIFNDAKNSNSKLSETVLKHTATYGIDGIDNLFPEAQLVNKEPELISRDDEWVKYVMDNIRKTPFARIKSTAANLTPTEARAKGYIKAHEKADEVISALKRVTTPQTVYKKQKLDRDDVIDITDFDVVVWLKAEMRSMLNEELGRAILIGDGRLSGADDKINESNIRPILSDVSTYTIRKVVTFGANPTNKDKADAIIEAAIRSRKDYKGSGNPAMFITPDNLATMLLAQDVNGRKIYKDTAELATALRVSKIIEVPVMEGASYTDTTTSKIYDTLALIVNLKDYTLGADKGGNINLFDDFDIDFNQYKYLMETRASGAMTKPYAAIAIEIERTVTNKANINVAG